MALARLRLVCRWKLPRAEQRQRPLGCLAMKTGAMKTAQYLHSGKDFARELCNCAANSMLRNLKRKTKLGLLPRGFNLAERRSVVAIVVLPFGLIVVLPLLHRPTLKTMAAPDARVAAYHRQPATYIRHRRREGLTVLASIQDSQRPRKVQLGVGRSRTPRERRRPQPSLLSPA